MVFAYRPVRRISTTLGVPKRVGQALAMIATFALSGLLHEGCLEGQVNQYYDKQLHVQHGHPYLPHESDEVKSEYGFGARHFTTVYAFTIQACFLFAESAWLEKLEPLLASHIWSSTQGGSKRVKVANGPLRSFLGWVWTMACMMYSGYHLSDVSWPALLSSGHHTRIVANSLYLSLSLSISVSLFLCVLSSGSLMALSTPYARFDLQQKSCTLFIIGHHHKDQAYSYPQSRYTSTFYLYQSIDSHLP
jgi:hypothetical protein